MGVRPFPDHVVSADLFREASCWERANQSVFRRISCGRANVGHSAACMQKCLLIQEYSIRVHEDIATPGFDTDQTCHNHLGAIAQTMYPLPLPVPCAMIFAPTRIVYSTISRTRLSLLTFHSLAIQAEIW